MTFEGWLLHGPQANRDKTVHVPVGEGGDPLSGESKTAAGRSAEEEVRDRFRDLILCLPTSLGNPLARVHVIRLSEIGLRRLSLHISTHPWTGTMARPDHPKPFPGQCKWGRIKVVFMRCNYLMDDNPFGQSFFPSLPNDKPLQVNPLPLLHIPWSLSFCP